MGVSNEFFRIPVQRIVESVSANIAAKLLIGATDYLFPAFQTGSFHKGKLVINDVACVLLREIKTVKQFEFKKDTSPNTRIQLGAIIAKAKSR